MKYIRCFIITSLLILPLLSVSSIRSYAQSFDERFLEISIRMDSLARNEIPGLAEKANFSVSGASVQELLRGVAATHNLNVNIDPSVNGQITNNFTNVLVRDLLLFVIREYRLDVRFFNNIISFYSYAPPVTYEPPKIKVVKLNYEPAENLLTLDLQNDSITAFAHQITEKTGRNVILAPGIEGVKLNGYIKEMPFDKALDKMAFMNGLELEISNDGFYILKPGENFMAPEYGNQPENTIRMPRNNNMHNPNAGGQGNLFVDLTFSGQDTLISIDAVNTPVSQIIQETSGRANKNYIFVTEPQGAMTCLVRDLAFDQFLSFALQATEFTYRKQEDVYLIGSRNQEGLRSSRLVKLQFRPIDSLQHVIPDELKKGISIQEFKELNAFILTGGSTQIDEIDRFLKALDQPVPNILIEVIVADVRKGVSIQTGIKAFLGDSVPQTTSGQVFPGVDVTLSSGGINNILDKLTDNGIVNLGRVTPRFYATLQAMEQNNLLNLRSTPKLSTLNGHEANMTIGQSRYYLEQTQNVVGGVTPINSVSQRWEKVEANLSITIYPIISGDEHITLDILAEFSDFVEPDVEGAPPGNATRQFTSKIRVRNEEMIVLGGLEEVRKSKSRSGLPLISRIPVLNWIFSARSEDNSEGKLMVFIKPTIVY